MAWKRAKQSRFAWRHKQRGCTLWEEFGIICGKKQDLLTGWRPTWIIPLTTMLWIKLLFASRLFGCPPWDAYESGHLVPELQKHTELLRIKKGREKEEALRWDLQSRLRGDVGWWRKRTFQLLSKVRSEHGVGKGYRSCSTSMKNQMFSCFKSQFFLTWGLVCTCLELQSRLHSVCMFSFWLW